MANASTVGAPAREKERGGNKKWPVEDGFLEQEFDPKLKYMFELANQNPLRQLPVIDMHLMRAIPHKPFIPYRNIVMTSQIIWKGQRRGIRYYDGCDTIFIDEQPKEKETIQSFIQQTQRRQFIDGKWGCYGDERMLLLFMLASSFNGESLFRTRTSDVVYIPVNAEKKLTQEAKRLDQIEQALELAKNATDKKMFIHADYLGIPLEDYDSGNALNPEEVRTAYRLEAARDAKRFTESYSNKALEVGYYIKKALAAGLIDTTSRPNKAIWKSSGGEICDISGLRSFDVISERLMEFSQTEPGEEFKIMVTALYNE